MLQRHEVDPSGQIMCLRDYAPWKSHIYDLEEALKVDPLIKFVLYEVGEHGQPLTILLGGHCVPVHPPVSAFCMYRHQARCTVALLSSGV